MPPLEVWEKVFVEDAEFLQSTHGEVGCVICHGGDSGEENKEDAHTGLIADPSEGNCDTCHSEIAQANEMSLHTTLGGYYTALLARGCDCEGDERLVTAIGNHCSECHSSCGQCHVSRPDSVGGGLVSGHKIKAKPSTIENCSACHGSRVDAEYFGRNEGIEGDLHRMAAGGMSCLLCHGEEIHGSGEVSSNMYDNAAVVQCEDCHQEVYTDDNLQHQQHIGDLSCYVCHSVEYKNCYNCHVEVSDVGNCLFSTDPSQMNFKIGLNPIQSTERPYEYAVLRHVPVNPEIFSFYGEDLMPSFSAQPTWKYTSPHNIQLSTPQNADCNSCHGHPELFLTEDDVDPAELEANRDVIVPEIPGQIP